MNMMQEKNTREYFLFLSGLAGVFVILALVLSWFHGRETQQILFEREQIFASSLMEQGVSHVSIARALGSAETTAEGAELLRQIGHTQAASFRLFPSIDRSVRLFGAAAAGTVGILAILLLGMSIRFLWNGRRCTDRRRVLSPGFPRGILGATCRRRRTEAFTSCFRRWKSWLWRCVRRATKSSR